MRMPESRSVIVPVECLIVGSVTGGGLPGARWRVAGAVAVKVVHTAIFAVISTCILHVFWAGVSGRVTRWTGLAIAVALAEGVVFFGNQWRCPLTRLTEKLGAESGRVTDIFLPRWFADRIPQIFTPLLVIGLCGLLWRRWFDRLDRIELDISPSTSFPWWLPPETGCRSSRGVGHL
jgi:hypothetical protein